MLEEYRAYLQEIGKSAHTVQTYSREIQCFQEWMKNYLDVDDPLDLGRIDVILYHNYLKEDKGFQPASVNTALAALESFSDWLMADGMLKQNPFSSIPRLTETETAPRWLNKSEKFRVVRVALAETNSRNTVIIFCLLRAGLRVSELINLQREDVVINGYRGKIIVRSGRCKPRIVPIPKDLREPLCSFLSGESSGQWLFRGRSINENLTSRAVQRLCSQIGKKAKVKELTPQILRHTYCRNLIDRGVDVVRVARLAGHGCLETTLKYVQTKESDLIEAVDKL